MQPMNIRWLQFGWTFLRNATIRAKLWHKVWWTVIPGQSVPADLEVTMVPAWVLQQTGTMITLGSPAAVRSQYQARDSGYLTLCSACSGYADFRHPLHAEQRINIHPSYRLHRVDSSEETVAGTWCLLCCSLQTAKVIFLQTSFCIEAAIPSFGSKVGTFTALVGTYDMCWTEGYRQHSSTDHKFLPSALLQRTFTQRKSDHKIKPTVSVLPKLLSWISQYVKKKLPVTTRQFFSYILRYSWCKHSKHWKLGWAILRPREQQILLTDFMYVPNVRTMYLNIWLQRW